MSTTLKIICVCLLAGGVYVAFMMTGEDSPSAPSNISIEPPMASPELLDPKVETTTSVAGQTIEPGSARVDTLRANAAAAAQATAAADEKVAALELEIEQIEQQIRDIEARGDDPAEHADEVLPYFEPLFARFLDAQAELETAIDHQEKSRCRVGIGFSRSVTVLFTSPDRLRMRIETR